jgi:hypothetical protein
MPKLDCTILVRGQVPDEVLAEIPGLEAFPVVDDTLLVSLAGDRDDLAALLQRLSKAGVQVLSASASPFVVNLTPVL